LLKYKLNVMLNYFGSNLKKYSTYPAFCTYDPSDPIKYYLSQSRRAFFDGPFDGQGIPLFNNKGD